MNAEAFYSLQGPLEIMPTGRQMRMAKLLGFPALVRSNGADARSLLDRFGIDPRFISDPDHYVDSKLVVDLFEHCSSAFNAPLFGLQLARHQEPDVFGCVAALCRAAPSFREALQCFVEYIPVAHSPAASLELVEGQHTAELRWHAHCDLRHNNQANYQALLLDLKLLRQIGGPAFRPLHANLAVDTRIRSIDEIERRLGCRFRYSGTGNAIAFPVEMLDRPVASANRVVFRLLSGYLDRVRSASGLSLERRVNDFLRGSLSSGHASIDRCAGTFGMSARTLQARLGASDLTFAGMLRCNRVELAKACLKDESMSLDEIAVQLGYSEQSSFGRAFRRWTGESPGRYRAASRRRQGSAGRERARAATRSGPERQPARNAQTPRQQGENTRG